MSKRFILLFTTILILGFQNSFAQTNDPILFSVEGNPVQLSEFEYIYSKTNGDKADFSKKSLDEYLDLYIKFTASKRNEIRYYSCTTTRAGWLSKTIS
jgi:peptidyl-prolyl cis-trans isomerase SurA